MGMTIDDAIEYFKNKTIVLTEEEALANTLMVKFAESYETRIKADKVAMLGEIQAQIDDLWEVTWNRDYRGGFKDGCIESNNVIQEKINALKAESEDQDGQTSN